METNNPVLLKLHNATEFAKNIVAIWNDRDNKAYPYREQPTSLMIAQAQYGAENIFMLSSDYHGHLEDDDCYFVYKRRPMKNTKSSALCMKQDIC